MPRTTQHPKEASFNLRIDPALKAAFARAAEAEDKPAAQVIRDLMRAYVARRAHAAEASRQSRLIADRARDPATDDAAVLREIDAELADATDWPE